MNEEFRDLILSAFEAALEAQLRAVRRLRQGSTPNPAPRRPKRTSQVDMAYDILKRARAPLHISELLAGIRSAFGVEVDRESLVSSLTKKVARGDRFLRTGRNTFALRPDTAARSFTSA
jgi:hypothetical protein